MGVAGNKAAIRVVHWDPDKPNPKPSREKVLSWPGISHYLERWERPEDLAFVALDHDGRRVGAAWYRLMSPEDPGYGFVDAATPEVGIAVVPETRGRGVGTALLRALMEAARSRGFDALSLSVEQGNPAVRLYEQHGFERLFVVGDAWTMKAELSAADDE